MSDSPATEAARKILENLPADQAILFFDGVCVLCSGFAQYVLKHDHRKRILLCVAQSQTGQAAYQAHGLDHRNFKTNLLLVNGRAYTKSEAFIQTMWILGGLNASAVLMRAVPRRMRDWIYDPIARNRYRWFGERQTCYLATPEIADRFIS
jgi:predicted DCC family thiol-disulfide oxidoreductase YuxK